MQVNECASRRWEYPRFEPNYESWYHRGVAIPQEGGQGGTKWCATSSVKVLQPER